MLRLAMVVLCGVALMGCEVTQVKGRIGGAEVKVSKEGDSHEHHGERFCPPGQAKKGNC